MLRCKKIETEADWQRFIGFPWSIYKGDPVWVPPLRIAVRDALNPKKNPFFNHARMLPLIVEKNGELVGRAIGVIDDVHNQFHGEKAASFGYFESIDDAEVTSLLMDQIAEWAKAAGMEVLRGPINLSTNNEAGLLIEGFEDSPTVMMTYNPRYYQPLLENCGFTKAKDLYAYFLLTSERFSEAIYRQSERLQRKSSAKFRPLDMKNYMRDVKFIRDIYNDAWERNWGFVPMDSAEIDHLAKDLKAILDPGLVLIAELNGEPVGFSVTLPDVNQIFKKVKDGKLFPTGLLKLLWFTKGPGAKNGIKRCRIVILGIKKAYQEMGLGPQFYVETAKRATQLGYVGGEASWVLEDNIPMNRALERMCGKRTKTYRIYEKKL